MQRGKQAHTGGGSSDHYGDFLSSIENLFTCSLGSDLEEMCFWGAPSKTGAGQLQTNCHGATPWPQVQPHDEYPHVNEHHAQQPHRSCPSAAGHTASIKLEHHPTCRVPCSPHFPRV